MTSIAREAAERQKMDIDFREADIRTHSEERSSLSGIYFTYESYSFLPDLDSRKALLRKMAGWLADGGVIFLSARLVKSFYQRSILSLQRLRPGRGGPSAWGDSHTRYLTPDGALHRSFVHYFTSSGLRREAAAAGLAIERFPEGHFELRRKSDDETA
jgi:hypothetical protein